MSETVTSQVAVIVALMERMEHQLADDRAAFALDRDKAELSRAAVSAELADIRHSQTDVHNRLDKIEPVTDLVTSVGSKIMGALILLGFIGSIAWGGMVFFKEVIVGWFQ
jgi:hypothetical protein